nr:hypothetical protein Iba_chr04aCG8220 [Ipomoea batatas]
MLGELVVAVGPEPREDLFRHRASLPLPLLIVLPLPLRRVPVLGNHAAVLGGPVNRPRPPRRLNATPQSLIATLPNHISFIFGKNDMMQHGESVKLRRDSAQIRSEQLEQPGERNPPSNPNCSGRSGGGICGSASQHGDDTRGGSGSLSLSLLLFEVEIFGDAESRMGANNGDAEEQ